MMSGVNESNTYLYHCANITNTFSVGHCRRFGVCNCRRFYIAVRWGLAAVQPMFFNWKSSMHGWQTVTSNVFIIASSGREFWDTIRLFISETTSAANEIVLVETDKVPVMLERSLMNIYSLVTSRLDYGNSLHVNTPNCHLQNFRLFKIQNMTTLLQC